MSDQLEGQTSRVRLAVFDNDCAADVEAPTWKLLVRLVLYANSQSNFAATTESLRIIKNGMLITHGWMKPILCWVRAVKG